jgi:SAM-dependent methyltransferase
MLSILSSCCPRRSSRNTVEGDRDTAGTNLSGPRLPTSSCVQHRKRIAACFALLKVALIYIQEVEDNASKLVGRGSDRLGSTEFASDFRMNIESEHIVALYERHADAWVQARLLERTLYEKLWLDRFCALLPSAGSVLDCGCGAGEPVARYLNQCGYAVMGIDSSPAMVRMFQARLPGQRAVVADMRTLCLPETFHGILAWDSFFHLNHSDQRNMFPTFRKYAAPGAALMFTSGPSHGEVVGRLEGEPLYHASLDAAEYRHLLGEQGFAVVDHRTEDQSCFGRTVWLAQLR